MRDYGKVHTQFWASQTIRGMSEDGRMLALYLMTSPHTTIAGVFRLPDGYVCEDLGWSAERVAEGFANLFLNGFANRCETTKWVWIIKHLEWNPPENPNQRKAAAKCAEQVPDACAWKAAFRKAFAEFIGGAVPEKEGEKGNGCGTVAEPSRNQKQEQEQEQKQEEKDSCAEAGSASPLDLPPPVFVLPALQGGEFAVYREYINHLQDLYPACHVEQEFRNMLGWLESTPKNRKTLAGMKRFVTGWLSRQQNRGGGAKRGANGQGGSDHLRGLI